MIQFNKYAKTKDKYCLCYFGNSDEYLVLLEFIKPLIEKTLSGLEVHIGCKDNKIDIIKNCNSVMKLSEIKVRRDDFGHLKEIRYNGLTHPIEDLLKECGIDKTNIDLPQNVITTKCVIISKGNYPTKDLEQRRIKILEKIAIDRGYSPEIDTDATNSGLVMGVESVGLFRAAVSGIETKLVPTGIGACLYKKLFASGEIMHI